MSRPKGSGARPLDERFWEKVDASGDCWEWTAWKTKGGYGTYDSPYGGKTTAHRVAWELLVGPIPDGMELDHHCFNQACVNPDHLQVVTHKENMKRARWGGFKANAARTQCPQGHPYDAVHSSGERYRRVCRPCKNEQAATPEKRKQQAEYQRAWRARNPHKQREYNSRRKQAQDSTSNTLGDK